MPRQPALTFPVLLLPSADMSTHPILADRAGCSRRIPQVLLAEQDFAATPRPATSRGRKDGHAATRPHGADVSAVQHLNNHPDWIPLYRDGRAALWGRRSTFADPASPRYVAPERR